LAERLAQQLSNVGVLGHPLGADVARAGQGRRDIGHSFFHIDERPRQRLHVLRLVLPPHRVGERLQTPLARDDGRASASSALNGK